MGPGKGGSFSGDFERQMKEGSGNGASLSLSLSLSLSMGALRGNLEVGLLAWRP